MNLGNSEYKLFMMLYTSNNTKRMKKIIINADDCGLSSHVNHCIEEAIKAGKISSTTIMANMDDFEGAKRLYKEFSNVISFGWHINLTEGEPLTYSQLLLDKGFYVEKEGKVLLNGKKYYKYRLNTEMKDEIKKELTAQCNKLRDNGIIITHADGHHHIHMAPSMISIMPSLFKELGVSRCRHKKNYGMSRLSNIARNLWTIPFMMKGVRMPDTLGDFITYYNNPVLYQGKTVELECHPGHPDQRFQEEMEMVYSVDMNDWGAQMITYREL